MNLRHLSAAVLALAGAVLPVPTTARADTFSYQLSGISMGGGCTSYDDATGIYTYAQVTAVVDRDHRPGGGRGSTASGGFTTRRITPAPARAATGSAT
jgi:hypothetical protein